jgi:hypothetical protein
MTNELARFNAVLRQVLSVPREELKRREEEWKRSHPQVGKKRGRKPVKTSDPVSTAKD